MGSITRTALVLACSAALAGGMALPASAADATTEATVEVAGGVLTMSAPAGADIVTPVSPGADATFDLSVISVTDTRAGILGWETTASLEDFVGIDVTHIIPAADASYDPAVTSTTGDATFTEAAGAVSLAAPVMVFDAADVTGNNSATWDAELIVPVPSDALADDYTATLTHSAL